jgi:2-amino-4-hydroxy-6-hydroxymethyldihydropteridine diphosphokinase
MPRAYLGLGTNVGDRHQHLRDARAALDALPGTRVVAWSNTYETDPVGPVEQGQFLNAACVLETSLTPEELLNAMNHLERHAGRAPQSQRVHWGPRELDVDLLLYDDRVIDTPRLKVPHPAMHERWFVLKPLTDIAADVVHPTTGKTIAELLAAVEQG